MVTVPSVEGLEIQAWYQRVLVVRHLILHHCGSALVLTFAGDFAGEGGVDIYSE